MIFRFQYVNQIAKIDLSLNEFKDLGQQIAEFDKFFYYSCGNILIYLFSVIDIISQFSADFNIISNSLIIYMKNALIFSIFFIYSFTILSYFVSINLFGDFPIFYHSQGNYILLKIIAMFYKGSIENVDYEPQLNYENIPVFYPNSWFT
jgi:hypothetical protein